MPLDRVLGFFDPLGDRAVGRRGRWRRAGSLLLLPLIVLIAAVIFIAALAGFVVITALAYASPQDPTWIAGLCDAADYDDGIRLLTDMHRHPNPAGEPGRPVAIGPTSSVLPRVAACSLAAVAQIAVLFAYRLRAPPKWLEPWSFFFLGLLTLRNARKPAPAAVQPLLATTVRPPGTNAPGSGPRTSFPMLSSVLNGLARVFALSPQTHLEAQP